MPGELVSNLAKDFRRAQSLLVMLAGSLQEIACQ